MDTSTAYIVIIEWDGNQPPTTWYSRMHSLAGRVRGDKDVAPLPRREAQGVIAQEGCIICPSYSLAKNLALLARDKFGAVSVQIGEAELQSEFSPSKADHEVLRRIDATLGKRGRKPAAQDFTVTCLEDMTCSQVNEVEPIQCPNCHGLRVHARKGAARRFIDDGSDIVELWARSRFSGPHWEPCEFSADATVTPPPMSDVTVYSQREARVVSHMFAANEVEQYVRTLTDRAVALRILDAVFVTRCYHEPDHRLKKRVRAATRYFQLGGDASSIVLDAGRPEPDLLDASGIFYPSDVVQHLMAYQHAQSESVA